MESDGENGGRLTLAKRLDREYSTSHLLTIRCFKPHERYTKEREEEYDPSVRIFWRENLYVKVYNSNFQQRDQVQVKVIVMDVDDNSPRFLVNNLTLGVRVNSPIYTELTTLKAVDLDVDSKAVYYNVHNLTFVKPG